MSIYLPFRLTDALIALLILIAVTALIYVLVSYIAARLMAQPPRAYQDANALYALEGLGNTQHVKFHSRDGIPLSGYFIPGPKTGDRESTILLTHGYMRSKHQMLPYASFLHKAGFNVLAFDFRGHGESGGNLSTIGDLEAQDILGALDFLDEYKGNKGHTYGVLGLSMGAVSAIGAAARDKRIKAVVSDSSYSLANKVFKKSFAYFSHMPRRIFAPAVYYFYSKRRGKPLDVDVVKRAGSLSSDQALLVIQGDCDPVAGPEDARAIYESALCRKEIWIVPGAAHVQAFEKLGSKYEKKVSNFFKESMSASPEEKSS